MSKNTSISFSAHFTDFIESLVASGRYGSASEVVRDGLRLLEEREAKLQKLRELIREGDESGESIPLDREKFFAEVRSEYSAKKRNA
ncbi:MAG TPA: type II toxin-antitoxin system ParD family antitoxin [Vitreimonas sp.]|uniref:type II toxin-antitoxin system ParD family antitoxin n=1 Tax=Vitreimonas sp. TaxID=3069702 RepID=UPI002D3410B1|nr:type II toxin-antitoxin system ParD family antitoxin [Vitreimonas sp.]HYD86625.1 type II toxin-antitoxin system ParD family antitoxin [Vitreimonas sp.]